MGQEATTERSDATAHRLQSETNAAHHQEIKRRHRLGRVWLLISLAFWISAVPPIIYAVAKESQCATRLLPNWLLGGCP